MCTVCHQTHYNVNLDLNILESLWLLGEEYENRIKNPRTSNDDVYAELLKAAAATVNLPDPSDPANEAQFSSM